MTLVRPTLLLDEQKCRTNIRKMVEKARRLKLTFRPHFKTHQSHIIGSWFREEGVTCITVSSIKMAKYFADDNWKDITVAFPLNALEYETINTIASKAQLNLCAVNTEALKALEKNLTGAIGIFIEIDCGYHRTGVDPGDDDLINAILEIVAQNTLLTFKGFLTHAGHSYKARSIEEIEAIHNSTIKDLISLRNRYSSQFPDLIISVGDTPTCSVVEDFKGVDEIRPGNFVFYDLTQCVIGSCSEDQVAVAMACPIVAIYPERNEIVIHGGGVHFSKDFLKQENGLIHYGRVVRLRNEKWERPIKGMYVKSLSQEHGIIYVDEDINSFKVGDMIGILPIHSCLTADVMRAYKCDEKLIPMMENVL